MPQSYSIHNGISKTNPNGSEWSVRNPPFSILRIPCQLHFNMLVGRFYILNRNHNWTFLLHDFFFFPFFFARIFFLAFSLAWIFFGFFPIPPITFLMVRPLVFSLCWGCVVDYLQWTFWTINEFWQHSFYSFSKQTLGRLKRAWGAKRTLENSK